MATRVNCAALSGICLALTLLAQAPDATARERRDIAFDCPCSADWTAGESGASGSLTLRAGARSYRATGSGEVRFSARWWDGQEGAVVGQLAERGQQSGEWTMAFGEPEADAVIEVHLLEQTGEDARGAPRWHRHEKLALWPVPKQANADPMHFVDILTDRDGDGVGDVNERLAGTSWTDAGSKPGVTVIDLLALYTAEFREGEAGYPYTRLVHLTNVASAVFADNDTNIRLRTVGMSEVELDEDGWADSEMRQELMDDHGADVTIQLGSTGPCRAGGGCAGVGAFLQTRWLDARAWSGNESALTAVHELGHVMGLSHSARQGQASGAWRWSRGHYLSPRGETPRNGTVMSYGSRGGMFLGGVFSNPTTDCGGEPCGVSAEELDGADSVTTLDRLRFQVGAHRKPAVDSDGDGFVDAADALPDDAGDWLDIDGDGIGDNADPDDDNDGTVDAEDAFPLDPDEWADADLDGIGDNADDDVQDLSPFRDPALRVAVEEALDKLSGAAISAEEMAKLTELRAEQMGIEDLTGLELATGVERVWLNGNLISDLSPLSGLTSLRYLDVASNQIVDLQPLQKLSMLRSLRLGDNPIEDISPLSALDRIADLRLDHTRVVVADVLALPYFGSLSGLGLSGLGVDDVSALADAPRLRSLGLTENTVSDIGPLAGLVELEYLYLGRNEISDVSPLAGLTRLRALRLEDNAVADIGPLADLVELGSLYLSANRIADVSPLAGLSRLWELRLDRNAVADIGPLADLVKLQWLSLRENRIADVSPLAGLTRLWWLRLDDNAVADIGPLVDRNIFGGTASAGAYVNLDRNPLGAMSVDDHIPTLRSWGVNVQFERRASTLSTEPIIDPTLRALVGETLAGAGVHVDDETSLWPFGRLRELRLYGQNIASLKGLEDAENLERLYAAANRIDDLAPLAQLENLNGLDLRNNRISDISALVANAGLGDGDWVALDGNPLSEESLNTHVPALIERGVSVSVGSIALSLIAGDGPQRFDVSGYFETLLDAGPAVSASASDLSVVGADAADGALVVTPGARAGAAIVTVEASDGEGEVQTLTFAVRVRGPWLVPLVPNAADTRQGFVRIVNHDPRAGEVRILPVDDAGMAGGRLTLAIGAGESVHFNSADLESGNPGKGLTGSSGRGTGEWRLELESDLELQVLSYVRTPDGFLTSMHDVAPRTRTGHRVPIFNPASNVDQSSMLRVTNLGSEADEVAVSGIDDHSQSPGGKARALVGAGASLLLTAVDLETGASGLVGRLGDGRGKWRLNVESDGEIAVMSLLASPEGHLTNLSTSEPAATHRDGVHTVPLFPSATDALGRQGFVRVVNQSDAAGEVRIQPYDDSGRAYEVLRLTMGPGRTAHFNSDDLELGNAAKGIAGSTGSGLGDWRLKLSSELDIEVLTYVRTPSGFLTSMHDTVFQTGRRYDVAMFNPGSNTEQESRLRIVNPGSRPAHVSVAGVDDGRVSSRDVVRVTVPASAAVTLTAGQMEGGDDSLRGAMGNGTGKWRLLVDSEQRVFVMSILASPTGHLTNLSTNPMP